MSRSMVPALAFALAAGIPSDARALLHVDPAPPPGGRRLLAAVEPLEPSAVGREVAAAALAALREAFDGAAVAPAAAALGRGLAAANAVVWEANRPLSGCGRGHRVYVGATAAAVEGCHLTIAQVPPSQAIVVQEGQLYAFPDLASWCPQYLPRLDRATAEPDPLGYGERLRPDWYHTICAGGDLALLCSTAIARALARDALLDGADPGAGLQPLLSGDPARALGRLEQAVIAHELDNAHAVSIRLESMPGPHLRAATGLLTRLGDTWNGAAARRPAGARTQPLGPSAGRRVLPPFGPATSAQRRRATLSTVGVPLDRAVAPAADTIVDQAPDAYPSADVALIAGQAVAQCEPTAWGAEGLSGSATPGAAGVEPEPLSGRPGAVDPVDGADVGIGDEDATDGDPIVLEAGPRSAPLGGDTWDAGSLGPEPVRHEPAFAHAILRGRQADDLPPVLADGTAVGPHVRRAQLLDRAQTLCVGLFERVVPDRHPPAMPFDAPARARAVPGVHSVRCYKETLALPLPATWRANLPRGPVIELPGRLLMSTLVVLLALGASGITYGRYHARSARVDSLLAAADGDLSAASHAADAGAAATQLGLAQRALDGARRNGAAGLALTQRQRALDNARDAARGVSRLRDAVCLGNLPAGLTGSPVSLVRSGHDVFVVGGGIYQFDPTSRRLTQLLAPGTRVGDGKVGSLQAAAWDAAGLTAIDGARVYTLGPGGAWRRQTLGLIADHSPWTPAAWGVYQSSVYLLAPATGQILKFPADHLSDLPEDWAGANPDLRAALQNGRDMVVDGKIYVLLNDGRILAFYRGGLEATLTPQVVPAVTKPLAFDGATDTNYLYVVDAGGGGGRIVRLARDGGQIQQLLLPATADGEADPTAAHALADAHDLLVDERAGLVYFVTGTALWRATLPASAANPSS